MPEPSVVIGPYRQQILPLAERYGLRVLAHEKSGASLIDSQRLAASVHAARADRADLTCLRSKPWCIHSA